MKPTYTASLHASLAKLVGSSVLVSPGNGFPEPGQASTDLCFEDGTKLRAEFWRLIEDGKASFSSFDHRQLYGLSATIDAVQELEKRVAGKVVLEALHDRETGDLLLKFTGDIKLQILNVTGYEIWEIRFPDGTGEYSSHAK